MIQIITKSVTVILKSADSRDSDLLQLEALKALPHIKPETRQKIETEIRFIQAGLRGEREAAYEIDFHSGASENRAVIHDLRLEHEGRVAQIDHVIINRLLQVFVIETKHFSDGLSINEQGEFTSWRNGKPQGIASPLAQNHRHAELLQAVMDTLPLPKRLGITLRPMIEPVVLISGKSRITRPTKFDTSRIIKADQFDQWLRKFLDDMSLVMAARMVSVETVKALGEALVKRHVPLVRDWSARFGIKDAPPPAEEAPAPTPQALEPELLPTSKLAARMGVSTATLTQQLENQGLLERRESRWYLTDAGKQASWRRFSHE